MNIEPIETIGSLKNVLQLCGLPIDDLNDLFHAKFFGISVDGSLVAVVGLELYGGVGLLRSLAVLPEFRNAHLGNDLVYHVESFAKQHRMERLYLLTTTAETYFHRLGYAPAAREGAPLAIRATSQFSGLCPASASFLMKQLRK